MNQFYVRPITVNVDDAKSIQPGNTLYESRNNYYISERNQDDPEVSIIVRAFNRIEKTKKCIEYILKYAAGIDYELILVDNGSTDKTYEFFQSVEYKRKKIVRISKNIGSTTAASLVYKIYRGIYYITISNDVYITPNCLQNMLKCIKADNTIGVVVPVGKNFSNFQEVDLKFNTLDEMQKKAEEFNKSDPLKWEERIRIVGPIAIYSREVIDLVGSFDRGFFHDFGEDDYSIRIRRAGYKVIVCRDSYAYHDHNNIAEGNDNRESLKSGRFNFQSKYKGLDAWDDVLNFELDLISMMDEIKHINNHKEILGIDTLCGTPILEVKNYLRKRGITDVNATAYTTDAKYYTDLNTISSDVQCNKINYIRDSFDSNTFNYIIIGQYINYYDEPVRILKDIINLLKKNGILLFKLKNISEINMLLSIFGKSSNGDANMPVYISIESIVECLKLMGIKDIQIGARYYNVEENIMEQIKQIVLNTRLTDDINGVINRLCTSEYLLCIQK